MSGGLQLAPSTLAHAVFAEDYRTMRADGLWRIEHVRADLRSERLAAVRRLGPPDPSYRKLTFYKEHLEQDQHLGDTYWPYVVWDPLENPDAVPIMVQNPGKHLDSLSGRYLYS